MRLNGFTAGSKRLGLLRMLALSAALGFAAPVAFGPAVSQAEPTLKESDEPRLAPPGVLISFIASWTFDDAGTNPTITEVEFSTTDYYSTHSISNGIAFLEAKSSAALNALSPRPSSPFTVDVTLTMSNDEGQTATGTVEVETTYDRMPDTPSAPNDPDTVPTAAARGAQHVGPGTLVNIWADTPWFNNAGTNPRVTEASFSTTEYYSTHEVLEDKVHLQVKTGAELSALPSPPVSPFIVTVTVTMTNDEGQTATGDFEFQTSYHRQ